MKAKDEILDYLKIRAERIHRDNPYLKKRIEETKKKIDKAVEEPSEICKSRTEHNFVLLSHVDTSEEAIYYFCCENCDEVVMTKQIRLANDPMRY